MSRGRRRQKTYWVADTESTVPPATAAFGDEQAVRDVSVPDDVHVWATSLTNIDDPDQRVIVDESMDAFMMSLMEQRTDLVVFFHNLSWDAYFILAYLARIGYHFRDNRQVEGDEQFFVGPGEVVILCSGTGSFYSVKFRLGRKLVELRDSLKLLPFSVDMLAKSFGTKHQKLKGTVDYGKPRPRGYHMTDTERRYCENDVLVVAEALKILDGLTPEWRDSLTIGSMCMGEYLKTFKGNSRKTRRDSYRKRFPELDTDTDALFRKAYYGGWCYVNPTYENQPLGEGHVYDVNSLYPSVMHGHVYPCGWPRESTRTIEELERTITPYYVSFTTEFHLRPRKYPFLQEGKHLWSETTHIERTSAPMDLTLSRPDYELFLECYEPHYVNISGIWEFDAVECPFDAYIDKWYALKQEATKTGERAKRQFAKLMQNNLYGKFAQSPVGHTKRFYAKDDYICSEDYMDERKGGYIPVGAYITAYARGVTVRAANANYEAFRYSDTDSIHLTERAHDIDVDPYRLGAWDNESDYTACRFVRQKTYIEKDAKTGVWQVKAAGCPQECKTRMMYRVTEDLPDGHHVFHPLTYDDDGNVTSEPRTDAEIMARFTYGLVETGKLRRVRVAGGVTMMPTTFRIHKVGT